MDARTFLGIEPTDHPLRWRLPVTPAVSTPGQFLFGGCGLAAGIVALEAASGRSTVWATAQYLAHAPTGSELTWEVTLPAIGKQVTQARAVARLADREVLTVNAALAEVAEPDVEDRCFASPPAVPAPEACPQRFRLPFAGETVFSRVDQRVAAGRLLTELDGTPGTARCASWLRVPGHLEPSAATLAILGDYVTGGVSDAVGRPVMSLSLDNTVRIVRLVPTEWVLADITIDAVAGGFASGWAHLFAEDGTLLASASQSMRIRRWRPEQVAALRAAAGDVDGAGGRHRRPAPGGGDEASGQAGTAPSAAIGSLNSTAAGTGGEKR